MSTSFVDKPLLKAATRARLPSPDVVTIPAKLRLPGDEDRTRHYLPFHGFALTLLLQLSPARFGWLQPLRIGWLHQSKRFAFPLVGRGIGHRRRNGDTVLHDRDRHGNDRRKGSIENDSLRPFAI